MADVWEWTQGPGHKKQPLIEFYIEQILAVVSYWIALRADKRGDTQTFKRMYAMAEAASKYEDDNEASL